MYLPFVAPALTRLPLAQLPCAILLAALLSALLGAMPSARAQQPEPGLRHAGPAALTDGLVRKVDQAAGELVIQHAPRDGIGMPAMTLRFGVADGRWLKTLKAGDEIRFAAEMRAGQPVVVRYEQAG